MRLLVTGASGFIGRNLVLASDPSWEIDAVYSSSLDFPDFLDRFNLGHVTPHRCDLSDRQAANELGSKLNDDFDTILWLAASSDPALSVTDPARDLSAGALALVNLLPKLQCGKLVYFSSGAVYDGQRGEVGPGTRLSPRLPYAVSKLACEHYVQWFRQNGRAGSFVILRFFGAYGPMEPTRKIYTRLVRWALAGAKEPFEIRGDGKNRIDAMYVGDAVRGIQAVLESERGDQLVDFASGSALTVNELVDRAAQILEVRKPKVRHVGSVPEYIDFHVSGDRMHRLSGFRATTTLEEGLPKLRDHLARSEVTR